MKRLAAAVLGLALSVSLAPAAHAQSLEYIDGTSSRVSGSVATGSVNFQTSLSDAVTGSTGAKREWRHGVGYDVVAYAYDAGTTDYPARFCGIKVVIDSDSALSSPDEWRLYSEHSYWYYPFTGNRIEFHAYPPFEIGNFPTNRGFSEDLYLTGIDDGQSHQVGPFDIEIPEQCPVPVGQSEVLMDSGWAKRMD